jgi:glycyl-tRNA synthetase beta chain
MIEVNMDRLLLEIGTEEIPAGYIQPALKALAEKLAARLADARIDHDQIRTYGTPRRLVVEVEQVAERQQAVVENILGPPEKVAFDQKRNPTMAAIRFAEKVGVPVNRLKIEETEKGRYLAVSKTEKGKASRGLLKSILPEVIQALPFPKTMRWADMSIQFARPIQSILALLGSAVIPFSLEGRIKSGRQTCGHMFMNPGHLRIDDAKTYLSRLREAHVVADIAERRNAVVREVEAAAAKLGGRVLPDEELLDIVTNLVEIPFAAAGRFDEGFLTLPREILITAMREHQKYFAVVDPDSDRLLPCFIAVNNTRTRNMKLVATGHERVLRARLSDAQFFYRSDREASMEAWVERLKGVLFQAKLGTMHAKMLRVKEMAAYLASETDPQLTESVSRAALLCKADLVSQVVVEFPKLQGIMGRVYATVAGEEQEVATAIEEHYRPIYSGASLPASKTGALLAIADKIDSICGCFAVGLLPTGASDPYALRRQAIGIVQIILDQGFNLSLGSLVRKSLGLFAAQSEQEREQIAQRIDQFVLNRISYLLAEQGYAKDVIAAVTSVSADRVADVWARVQALEKMKHLPDFGPLAAAIKRVVNILRKADPKETQSLDVDCDLFQHASESALYQSVQRVRVKVADQLVRGNLEQALLEIASLRGSVDGFFDGVLVMAPEPPIRRNRLALLGVIAELFEKIADFSKIST